MNTKANDWNRSFDDAYQHLNPAQRQAVDATEGPVLVIAGPGTGKTQILATRIGNILKKTDTPAGSILCLTYTTTGCAEMRNRLFKLIGPAAYRVNIHTFHSFCNEVIQDNASYFGRQNLDAISELEEVELFQKLLDNLPADNPLKIFKEFGADNVKRVKNFFSLFKKQAWDVAYLNKCIDDYLTDLPTKEEYIYKRKAKGGQKGEPKQALIKDEKLKMEKLRAAVNLYPQYEKAMKTAGRYTFDDMILWVLKAFNENESMLQNYQERYLYFLIDEFQDTSRSQNLLLYKLIEYWDKPNVFAVGDDDQSIFSFQDANVENIRKFGEKFESGLKTIVLTENYRSGQPILNWATKLIKKNNDRLQDIDKNLKSSKPAINNIPEIIEYQSIASETINVAGAIVDLIEKGVQPKEIGVIYRNHDQVDGIESFLRKKNIDVNIKRKINILDTPFINKIITILSYFSEENEGLQSAQEKLFQLLHFDFFKLSPLEIAKISVEISRKNNNEKYRMRRYLSEQLKNPAPDLFNPQEKNELKRVGAALEGLFINLNNVTLQFFFEEVIREAGILNYVMQSPEKPWLLEVLSTFFSFIKMETRKKPDTNLRDILQMIATMKKYELRMELQKITSSENGVNLMSAHGSKGTEYEYVFIIGCTDNKWGVKSGRGGNDFKLPDNLSGKEITIDELEESRRLFYVAMTRAKNHLTISYLVADDKGKLLVPSVFIGELVEGESIVPMKKTTDKKLSLSYIEMQFHKTAQPKIELLDREFIKKILENYSLSVTHLNNFLKCPITFYYQNLIKVPAAIGEGMAFGTVIHSTLEELFRKMLASNQIFPSKEEMLDDLKRFLNRNRASFTKEQYNRRLDFGKKILLGYYNKYQSHWNKNVWLEYKIRNVEVQGVPINGKLDKLEFIDKQVNVVDYKTGSYERVISSKKLKVPNETNPLGGDYWRQAVFYKILLDNSKYNNLETVSSEFDFIEPVNNDYKTEKIIITPDDVVTVTKQIVETWGKIQNQQFDIGCGKEDCHWCNFVKDNNFIMPLHEITDEEEATL